MRSVGSSVEFRERALQARTEAASPAPGKQGHSILRDPKAAWRTIHCMGASDLIQCVGLVTTDAFALAFSIHIVVNVQKLEDGSLPAGIPLWQATADSQAVLRNVLMLQQLTQFLLAMLGGEVVQATRDQARATSRPWGIPERTE